MQNTSTKTTYLCEDCYETWTTEKPETTCPYCGSDMITNQKPKQ